MKPFPWKTIIFDFDGVILDTAGMKSQAFVDCYPSLSRDKKKAILDYVMPNGGLSRTETFKVIEEIVLERTPSDRTLAELCILYGRIVDAQLPSANFVKGAEDAIGELRNDCPLHVVSGAPESDLLRTMADRGILPHFTTVAGAPKQKAREFERIMRRADLSPVSVLAIGDSLTEFEAARQLSIPFLAIVGERDSNPFPSDVPFRTDLVGLREIVIGFGAGEFS